MKLCLLFALASAACTSTPDASSTSSGGSSGGAALTPAAIALTPTGGVNFGTVSIGVSRSQAINVVNSGQATATAMVDASTGLGAFSYAGGKYPGTGGSCGNRLDGNDVCTLVVTFTPTATTAQAATISLAFNDSKNDGSATLPLSGSGRDPKALTALAGIAATSEFLGTVTTDKNGRSPTLQAVKNADDDAITLIAFPDDPTAWVVVDALTAPANGATAGVELASLDDFDTLGNPTPAELNRSFPAQGVQAVMIPQTPDIAAQTPSGSYSFSIVAFDDNSQGIAGANIDVYVVHTNAGHRHVTVNLFFSGSAGLNASNAKSDANFQKVVQGFVGIWGQGPGTCTTAPAGSLGLCIDSVNYIDLLAGYTDIAGDASEEAPPQKDLEELFMQSAGHPQGVNFFFIDDAAVDGLSSSSGLLGLDGSIPSPGALQGTPRSGAVVILDSVPSVAADIQSVAATIAHEGGHYLGLYHNQESDCSIDNLSDTPCDPACACRRASDCEPATECLDSQTDTQSNIMFWGADPNFPQTIFSDEQATTALRHPLVH